MATDQHYWLRPFWEVRSVECQLDDEWYWRGQAPEDGSSSLLRVHAEAPAGTLIRVLNIGSPWGNELVAPLDVALLDPIPPFMELSTIKPAAVLVIGLSPPKAATRVLLTLSVQVWR